MSIVSTTADPLQLFTCIIEEAFNTGDVAILDDLVSPDFVEHQFATLHSPAPVGPVGVAAIVRELRRGADDFHLAIEDSVVAGDTVWVRLTGTGTDTGGQLGRPPSGRPFTITVIDIARFERGRMVEHWGMPDRLGVLLQTGALSGA